MATGKRTAMAPPRPAPSRGTKPPRASAPRPPRGAGPMLAALRGLAPSLPPTARRIAGHILVNREEVIRMSITELADQVGASEGSIVGLCQRLGARGFQELKILLARELVDPVQMIHEDLHENDDFGVVADRVFAAHAASLAETRSLISPAGLEAAVGLLLAARRIEIYGIGSSAPVAEDFAYRLLRLGRDAKAVTDSHIQAVSAAMCGRDVAVVTVSHSGSTVETVLATRLARERGARTIGITRIGKSPLVRHCEVVLCTVANETRYRPEAMSSRVAQLALVDTLVSCTALSDPKRAIAQLELSARVLAEKRY